MIRTLFAKILLWSVAVQFVTVGTILALVTLYLPQSQEAVNNAFALYADTAVALYENFGPEALDKFLARSGENTLLQLKLSASSAGAPCASDGDESANSTSILAQGRSDSYCLTVHSTSGALPESPESRDSRMKITILLELVSCAGLSYVIARYLSRPISDLRQAAIRLAKGDLTVRVGAKFRGRRDEAADLMREFDQMADRVATLIQAQQRLIGDVSHEIKSPLARLNMALSLARRDAEQYAPRQFERMQREIDNIATLSRELLILAGLDANARVTHGDPVVMADVIADILSDIAFEFPDRAGDMVLIDADRDAIVTGDRALLCRAVENVLRNAVFYTTPGAAIEIRCRLVPPGRVRITIEDHGPGVPEPALAHLFDPFYRVDDARNRQTGGTGIGLAICQRAVELHRGSIDAANVIPHGLAVVMDLPQADRNDVP